MEIRDQVCVFPFSKVDLPLGIPVSIFICYSILHTVQDNDNDNDIQSSCFADNAESLQAADAESGEQPKQKRSLKAKLKSMFESSKPAATATNFQVWIMIIILQNVLTSFIMTVLYAH